MTDTFNLHGRSFRVASTAAIGVVSSDTELVLAQKGTRVLGRYGGGTIGRGVLVGRIDDGVLLFRYAQRELDGAIHGGRSTCDLRQDADGRVTILEHFTWETRTGSGTNVFVESA